MTTAVVFKTPTKIEGWADDGELFKRIQLAPNALSWTRLPILTFNFIKMTIGSIDLLEYRDGNLWIEATLNEAMPPGELRFSVGFMIDEYVWHKSEIEFFHCSKGRLLEVSLIPVEPTT